jgi:hypothetical protein
LYLCESCRLEDNKRLERNRKQREHNRSIRIAHESCGLKRVRGALGGVYWE